MKQLLLQKQIFKVLFWTWGLTILILSSLPNIPTQKINIWEEPFRLDYLEHFGVFAIWGSLFILWKAEQHDVFILRKRFWAILSLIAFACADEAHQIWIPGRTFNPLDLFYNVAGLFTAFALIPMIIKKIHKKSS